MSTKKYRISGSKYSYRERQKRKERQRQLFVPRFIFIIFILIAGTTSAVVGIQNSRQLQKEKNIQWLSDKRLNNNVSLEQVNLRGLTIEEAREKMIENYPWDMKILVDNQEYEVFNFANLAIDNALQKIYKKNSKGKYFLQFQHMQARIEQVADDASNQFDQEAKDEKILEFDPQTQNFTYAQRRDGVTLDKKQLIEDIQTALKTKKFQTKIEAKLHHTVARDYQTLSVVSIDLEDEDLSHVCEKVSGTVIKKDEIASVKAMLKEGVKTEGADQMATAIYNAAINAGLKIKERYPAEQIPKFGMVGQDATIDSEKDLKFENTTGAEIGIIARIEDKKLVVELVGFPVLSEGEKIYLVVEQRQEDELPQPEYIADRTLKTGVEIVAEAGMHGGLWRTKLVKEKKGKVEHVEILGDCFYKGRGAVIRQGVR